jgi:hypothetical protein
MSLWNDLLWDMPILWENGLGGLGGFARIFLFQCAVFKQNQKKISVNPPNPPNPFSHSIGIS